MSDNEALVELVAQGHQNRMLLSAIFFAICWHYSAYFWKLLIYIKNHRDPWALFLALFVGCSPAYAAFPNPCCRAFEVRVREVDDEGVFHGGFPWVLYQLGDPEDFEAAIPASQVDLSDGEWHVVFWKDCGGDCGGEFADQVPVLWYVAEPAAAHLSFEFRCVGAGAFGTYVIPNAHNGAEMFANVQAMMGGNPCGCTCALDDLDCDGMPDSEDCDDDGDGTPDVDEDDDGDGVPNKDDPCDNDPDPECEDGDRQGDDDGDGKKNCCDGDDDNDGLPDWIDCDWHGEGGGCCDEDEGCDGPDCDDNNLPWGDPDGDGVPNWQDWDDDNDGTPDWLDDDDDNDGRPDSEEDSDGDGIPDGEDEDWDGDGVPDPPLPPDEKPDSDDPTCANECVTCLDGDEDGKVDDVCVCTEVCLDEECWNARSGLPPGDGECIDDPDPPEPGCDPEDPEWPSCCVGDHPDYPACCHDNPEHPNYPECEEPPDEECECCDELLAAIGITNEELESANQHLKAIKEALDVEGVGVPTHSPETEFEGVSSALEGHVVAADEASEAVVESLEAPWWDFSSLDEGCCYTYSFKVPLPEHPTHVVSVSSCPLIMGAMYPEYGALWESLDVVRIGGRALLLLWVGVRAWFASVRLLYGAFG